MFLKSKTKIDRKSVEITLEYKVSSVFCEKEKNRLQKMSVIEEKDLSISCL